MKTVLQANPISLALGKQPRKDDNLLRPLFYCMEQTVGDNVILYNNLTKELIAFDKAERNSSELSDYLYDNWFVVPTEHNDKELALEIRSLATAMRSTEHITSYTIVTTMDCNARCFYCYEHGCEKVSMSNQTALDTAEFIRESCGGEEVLLRWFGGEPLFNSEVIDIITFELTKAGISFSSTMTSNSYLFDDWMVDSAVKNWHLKKIQITLDGTEEIYNKRKAYINNVGSAFVRVTDNIEKLLKAGVEVNIRLNMDCDNVDDLIKLCDFLAARYNDCKGLNIYASYITSKDGTKPLRGSRSEVLSSLMRLRERTDSLCSRKINRYSLSGIETIHCMADNDAAIVISPTGDLRKCQHNYQEKPIGTIYTGVQDLEAVYKWKEQVVHDVDCCCCPLFPDCIHLKNCIFTRKCKPFERERNINVMKKQIQQSYEKYLETERF
ncbi:MAG: radical SAM protein [Oscillospiraceae bacterium]|nr:radical SAM protein [Oscillospiraceae bacterium]